MSEPTKAPEPKLNAPKKKKPKTQDRPFMDASSPGAKKAAKTFLDGQADDDRLDAKAKHLRKGLRAAKDNIAVMASAVAHGLKTDNNDVMKSCLDEIGALGNDVRDLTREAVRNSITEKRNLQPTGGATK